MNLEPKNTFDDPNASRASEEDSSISVGASKITPSNTDATHTDTIPADVLTDGAEINVLQGHVSDNGHTVSPVTTTALTEETSSDTLDRAVSAADLLSTQSGPANLSSTAHVQVLASGSTEGSPTDHSPNGVVPLTDDHTSHVISTSVAEGDSDEDLLLPPRRLPTVSSHLPYVIDPKLMNRYL